MVSFTSSTKLLLFNPLLLFSFSPRLLVFSCRLFPELLRLILLRILLRPLGFVAIGCRLFEAPPLLLGLSLLGTRVLSFTADPCVKLPDLLPGSPLAQAVSPRLGVCSRSPIEGEGAPPSLESCSRSPRGATIGRNPGDVVL